MEDTEFEPPEVAEHRGDPREDILTFTALPSDAWRRTWSNNPTKPLNRGGQAPHGGHLPQLQHHHPFIGAVLTEYTPVDDA
ncbi:transposase [Gordonia sp. (in: high G+C Gram-positive bacteria)]|uniref:transposase n=1 Tax=Gordonia sp. (in: high G+C Gram-positive bacteria) TaxID=84139 RepID=UPI001D338FB8|nr:transposase [Gordonia sp. (in: high G+C Gram-positive bacteria)]